MKRESLPILLIFEGRLQLSPTGLLTILKRKVLVSHLAINLLDIIFGTIFALFVPFIRWSLINGKSS